MQVRRVMYCALLAMAFAASGAWADSTLEGTWTAQVQGRNGPQTQTFVLKVSGDAVSGTVGGGQGQPTAIADGKVSGSTVTFTVTREMRGNSVKQTYTGTLDGDTIHFKVATEGQDQAREFDAKRGAAGGGGM